MTIRRLAGLGALAVLAVAGGWAVSSFRALDTEPTPTEITPTTAALAAEGAATATDPGAAPAAVAAIPNADALPPDAGGIDGVEQVLLMSPGTPRAMPPGALFGGDELVEERYLQSLDLNGQQVDVFRYLKRNANQGPGTFLCFTAAIGDRVGGGSCTAMGDPPDPTKPGSRAIGGDELVGRVPLGSGMAFVLQVPPGTTHVTVDLRTVGTVPAESGDVEPADSAARRLALIPRDGIAVVAIPGGGGEQSEELTAWAGPTLLASDHA